MRFVFGNQFLISGSQNAVLLEVRDKRTEVRVAPQTDFTLRTYDENKLGILKRFSVKPFP